MRHLVGHGLIEYFPGTRLGPYIKLNQRHFFGATMGEAWKSYFEWRRKILRNRFDQEYRKQFKRQF